MSYSNRFNCPLYSNSLLFQLLYQLGDRGRRINQLSYLVLVEAVYIVKANVCQGGGGISTIFVLMFLHRHHLPVRGKNVLATEWLMMSVQEHQNKDGADTTSYLANNRLDKVDRFHQDETEASTDPSSSV